jgi:GNAT superfamily N-acetyltransferase
MGEIRIEHRSDAGAACRAILDELPHWFGIEEANDGYVAAAEQHLSLVGVDEDGTDVGIITLVQHGKRSAEVHLLAVRPHLHRTGIGTQLLQRGEAVLRGKGVRFLQVKTLSPAHPDEGYARTRAFYEARGFVTLEDFPDLWDPQNPARQMIKTI